MLRTNIPAKFVLPFANAAGGSYIRAVPAASQIGIQDGAASLTDGFPPLNFLPLGAGGVPPFGQDFNGLLNQISAWNRWQAAGGTVQYDSTWQASPSVGGYPQGALVTSATTLGLFWFSIVDNNLTNPDTGGAGWVAWRLPLPANTTIYVNASTGSDTLYDGSSATVSGSHGPFQTIGRAMAYATAFGPSAYTLTIQVADGTYNEAVTTPTYAIPNVVISGNVATPSNVLVTGAANQHTFQATGPNTVTVQNLKATAANSGASNCAFFASNSASLTTNNTVNGAVNYAVFEAQTNATVSPGAHTFSGNFTFGFNAINGGIVILSSLNGNFTISTTITITVFASAASAGNIAMSSGFQPTFGGAGIGAVTGQKYNASLNAIINTAGEGANYFPGNGAGSTSTGGQYA